MDAEAELQMAAEAGARFKVAILGAAYNAVKDEVTFETPWGNLTISRAEIPILKDVAPSQMGEMYVSHTGVHIDNLDLDVNSAGLLAEIFHVLGRSLSPPH